MHHLAALFAILVPHACHGMWNQYGKERWFHMHVMATTGIGVQLLPTASILPVSSRMQAEADVVMPYLDDSLNIISATKGDILCIVDLVSVQEVWEGWRSADPAAASVPEEGQASIPLLCCGNKFTA